MPHTTKARPSELSLYSNNGWLFFWSCNGNSLLDIINHLLSFDHAHETLVFRNTWLLLALVLENSKVSLWLPIIICRASSTERILCIYAVQQYLIWTIWLKSGISHSNFYFGLSLLELKYGSSDSWSDSLDCITVANVCFYYNRELGSLVLLVC